MQSPWTRMKVKDCFVEYVWQRQLKDYVKILDKIQAWMDIAGVFGSPGAAKEKCRTLSDI